MRMRDELWQGNFGYWQNQFIHYNILLIGHSAWLGYQEQGRGMVVCEVVDAILPYMDWAIDPIAFHHTFVPQAQVSQHLQTMALASTAMAELLATISTYEPTTAIVVLVMGNNTVSINLLSHLAVSPADCYQQVQQRSVEFQLTD